ncbi:hypothetical protein DENIS_1997 [Desulfonema ishimotonii]|uniref:Uncharacterized protein n=1 Tax=Desulfonema ishimotonii TaxID=45657 RepID=A0A401FVN1_9BACT|nr:hypothetical protein [Desulfonema ishimotonii]GBC61037.1 hypothetical protein DENIS_1997 [Desulfonema ishimotonii]
MQRIALSWIFFLILFVSFPNPGHAKAKRISRGQFEVNGYRVNVSGQQKNGKLCVRGRVSYGEHCDRLQMKFTLENQHGKRKTVTTIVEDAGGAASPIIDAEKKIVKRNTVSTGDRWEIVNISAKCRD